MLMNTYIGIDMFPCMDIYSLGAHMNEHTLTCTQLRTHIDAYIYIHIVRT